MGEGNELPQGKVLVYTSSAALAMAMFGGAAHAEEPAKAKDNAPEIVVTAQFRSQKLQDVPIAITAVNSAMLEQRGATNIADIGASAPNVTLRPAAASFGPSVVAYIRGVGQRDTNFALEPGSASILTMFICPRCMGRCSIWSIWIGWRSCAGRKAHWRDRIPSAGPSSSIPKARCQPGRLHLGNLWRVQPRRNPRWCQFHHRAGQALYAPDRGGGAQGRLCHPL
jgi:hypothetical protein